MGMILKSGIEFHYYAMSEIKKKEIIERGDVEWYFEILHNSVKWYECRVVLGGKGNEITTSVKGVGINSSLLLFLRCCSGLYAGVLWFCIWWADPDSY